MEGDTQTTPPDQAQLLTKLWQTWRQPPPETIAKLPKRQKRQDDSYYEIKLDYMGHAEVTEALLEADPFWDWEPLATNDDGTPVIKVRDGEASMWIKLTIHGLTRLGVGTCSAGKSDVEKELIGDAIRNAAMRFGVAIRLWSKAEGLQAEAEHAEHAEPPAKLYSCPVEGCAFQLEAGPMKTHLRTVHNWVRGDDGKMKPPQSPETPPEAAQSAAKPSRAEVEAQKAEEALESLQRAFPGAEPE